MEKKTIKRIKKYYRIKFKITSPLSIGSGNEKYSDSDIAVDGRGYPYIPGTALAGVYRHLFPNDVADEFFGPELNEIRKKQAINEGRNVLTDSLIVVYDGVIQNPNSMVIKNRDMVALDEYKVAKKGAKFEFQILEPGAVFVTYIEQNMTHEEEAFILDEIAYAWKNKEILLGAKTGRGYGATEVVELMECSFDLTKREGRRAWLEFDMYKENEWHTCECIDCLSDMKTKCKGETADDATVKRFQIIQTRRQKDEVDILLSLKLCGALSVRQYSTDIHGADYSQLTLSDDASNPNGTPVIPGTSWAGAFRAQMEKLDPKNFGRNELLTKKIFGDAKEKKRSKKDVQNGCEVTDRTVQNQKTRVRFSESQFEKGSGRWEHYTRNAIDRFSGGTVEGALYTEHTYFDGKTDVRIVCDYSQTQGKQRLDDGERESFASVLAAAILDLHEGFMSVGGLTAVGHGIFQVERAVINGQEISIEYNMLKDAIKGKGDCEVNGK